MKNLFFFIVIILIQVLLPVKAFEDIPEISISDKQIEILIEVTKYYNILFPERKKYGLLIYKGNYCEPDSLIFMFGRSKEEFEERKRKNNGHIKFGGTKSYAICYSLKSNKIVSERWQINK